MTTHTTTRVRCALCRTRSTHQSVASTNSVGSVDLDACPAEMHRSTMPYGLQVCPSCSFVAANLERSDPGAKQVVASTAYQQTWGDASIPHLARVFQCRALIDEAARDWRAAFENMLAAAWVADDADMADLGATLRSKAASYLGDSFRVSPIDRLPLVDVLRRSGD